MRDRPSPEPEAAAPTVSAKPPRPSPPRPSSGRVGRAETPPKLRDAPERLFQKGDWLWACRAGFEADLVDELELSAKGVQAEPLVAGLVRSNGRPMVHGSAVELAFARQGFPVESVVHGDTAAELGSAIITAVGKPLAKAERFGFQVWVADNDVMNRLSQYADTVADSALAALAARLGHGRERLIDPAEAPSGGTPILQACVLDRGVAATGLVRASQAVSPVPGGRMRIGAPKDAPSRAAAKLLEAFEWLGRAPEPGDVCVDLGAAPGGWSHVLLEKRAKVIAVDPARLAPHIARNRNMRHIQQSAFQYAPDEPVDWLFCDMAWRPLEVAALLAKWGRNRWTRFLVANIKLPMKKKVEYLWRVKDILATGNWQGVRVRQLYHDRDEVTLAAWVLG